MPVARPRKKPLETEMSWIQDVLEWFDDHRDVMLDLIRIYLGIGLFAQGIYFVSEKEFLGELLVRVESMPLVRTFMLHYVPIAHLGGGLTLAAGLLTRTSAIFQLPPLFGAVFLIHLEEGLFTHGQSLEFTALVLFILLLLAFAGGGRMSLDHYMKIREGVPR